MVLPAVGIPILLALVTSVYYIATAGLQSIKSPPPTIAASTILPTVRPTLIDSSSNRIINGTSTTTDVSINAGASKDQQALEEEYEYIETEPVSTTTKRATRTTLDYDSDYAGKNPYNVHKGDTGHTEPDYEDKWLRQDKNRPGHRSPVPTTPLKSERSEASVDGEPPTRSVKPNIPLKSKARRTDDTLYF